MVEICSRATIGTVAQVMTRRVHIATQTTSPEVITRVMRENQIGALPIVDPQGHVVALVGEAESPVDLSGSGSVVTVAATTPIQEAQDLMIKHHLRHLVVLDGGGRLEGIVSRSDLSASD
ncbi:MAG TPA: CBS domain-containing protein [Candidatus Dormibacteraeota bacterium]|jgi:CBS domain-containing protein|nr:CBS domain-containing protein [Candidatus Dormibacteraeota bacterium]